MLVSIYRYNPESDEKPYMQELNIKLPEGKDLMVLDVLALAKQAGDAIPREPEKMKLMGHRARITKVIFQE